MFVESRVNVVGHCLPSLFASFYVGVEAGQDHVFTFYDELSPEDQRDATRVGASLGLSFFEGT